MRATFPVFACFLLGSFAFDKESRPPGEAIAVPAGVVLGKFPDCNVANRNEHACRTEPTVLAQCHALLTLTGTICSRS